jgi:16S rRNA (guanine527-N7)-methyltransferase
VTADSSKRIPEVARAALGDHVDQAARFAELLRGEGVVRGLIGPREIDRLWERHLLNSAVLAELLPPSCRVVDVGSGAGLPGIPLAITRPDITLTLLEPMARRVAWLREVVTDLELPVEVVRGRAEEHSERDRLAGQDVVVARAVAPLDRLARWCLPLVRVGGEVLAIKGVRAVEEVAQSQTALRRAGGDHAEVLSCGNGVLDVPTTVVRIVRVAGSKRPTASTRRRAAGRRTRKDQGSGEFGVERNGSCFT